MCKRFTRSTNFVFPWEKKNNNTNVFDRMMRAEKNCRRMKSAIMVGLINFTVGFPGKAEMEAKLAYYVDCWQNEKRQWTRMGTKSNRKELSDKRLCAIRWRLHSKCQTICIGHWLNVFHTVATLPCVRINVQNDSPVLFMWLHRGMRHKKSAIFLTHNPHWPSGWIAKIRCMHSP